LDQLFSICAQKQVQQVSAGNGAAARKAPVPTTFRRRPVDSDEFKQQRAESEAEAERNRKRSGQSASFASLYGTKVGRELGCGVMRARQGGRVPSFSNAWRMLGSCDRNILEHMHK